MLLKRNAPALLAIALSMIVLGVFFLSRGSEDRTKFDWREHYEKKSRQPYGTDLIFKLLGQHSGSGRVKEVKGRPDQYLTATDTNANYILIGQAFVLDPNDIEYLLRFVENGNVAFFSSKSVPFDLVNRILRETCSTGDWVDYATSSWDTAVQLSLTHPSLDDSVSYYKLGHYRNGKPNPYYHWSYFDYDVICDSTDYVAKLGRMNAVLNFVRIRYGKGYFLLHTTPLAFTNVHLLDPHMLAYAERVFSHLKTGTVYADVAHAVDEAVSRRRNGELRPQSRLLSESPLSYILSQPPLAWSWYLLLSLALLYLLFRAKRRQRVIPVLEKNSNSSLEFIATMGRLYFQQGNPRQLALHKMKYLQGFIRERYRLVAKDWDELFLDQLHLKSEVPRPILERIALMHRNILSSNAITDKTLLDFHQLMDEFYKLRK